MTNVDEFIAHMLDSGGYDPARAHEYYLRNRELKGRRHATQPVPAERRSSTKISALKKPPLKPVLKVAPKKSAAQTRKDVEARVASLKGKLARLSQILEQLVKEAKARSGVVTPDKKSLAPTAAAKAPSKMTLQEKAKAAKASKEYYDKNIKESPDQQAAALEKKIAAVQEKIKEMKAEIAAAKQKAQKSTTRSVGVRATITK